MRKVVEALSTILFVILLIIGITIIALVVSGRKIYAIQTGSMGQDYPIGALVLVSPVGKEDLQVGDVITYNIGEKKTTVTHRIASIPEGGAYVLTKGDANADIDSEPVFYDNIVGRVIFCLPYLGHVILWSKTVRGRCILLAVIFLQIMIYLYTSVRSKKEETDVDEAI